MHGMRYLADCIPSEIENYYPDLWQGNKDDERSQNKYEKELLQLFLIKKIKLRK